MVFRTLNCYNSIIIDCHNNPINESAAPGQHLDNTPLLSEALSHAGRETARSCTLYHTRGPSTFSLIMQTLNVTQYGCKILEKISVRVYMNLELREIFLNTSTTAETVQILTSWV